MLEQVDKCLKSLTLAVIDDFSLTGIKSEGIGILIDVVDDGTSTGEMGFTYSNSEITWGLESIESFQATIELWKNMGQHIHNNQPKNNGNRIFLLHQKTNKTLAQKKETTI